MCTLVTVHEYGWHQVPLVALTGEGRIQSNVSCLDPNIFMSFCLWISTAVITHHDQTAWGEKGLFHLTSLKSPSIPEQSQGRA